MMELRMHTFLDSFLGTLNSLDGDLSPSASSLPLSLSKTMGKIQKTHTLLSTSCSSLALEVDLLSLKFPQ